MMVQESYRLKVCSYNSNGSGINRRLYIKHLFHTCDTILLVEHWLYTEHLNIYTNDLEISNICGVSAMNQKELLKGCPFGGTAIIWKSNLRYKLTPRNTISDRVSAVQIQISKVKLLLCNVYMPCNSHDAVNKDIFDTILVTTSGLYDVEEYYAVIIGGDFNTDFTRYDSTNTNSLTEFLNRYYLHCLTQHADIDYTFDSKSSQERFLIDHFFNY